MSLRTAVTNGSYMPSTSWRSMVTICANSRYQCARPISRGFGRGDLAASSLRPLGGRDRSGPVSCGMQFRVGGAGLEKAGSAVPRRALARLGEDEKPKSSGDPARQGCVRMSRALTYRRPLRQATSPWMRCASANVQRLRLSPKPPRPQRFR
jgi:hypothetical protein